MKLYELASEYEVLMGEVDDAGGVLDEQLEARFDAIGGAFADKAEACAVMVRTFEARADAYRAEEKRLADRRKAADAAADRIKAYVHACMAKTGQKRVEGRLFTVAIQANPPSVEVTCEISHLPAAYQRTVTTTSADKAALKAALVAGEVIDGVALVRGESLRIR